MNKMLKYALIGGAAYLLYKKLIAPSGTAGLGQNGETYYDGTTSGGGAPVQQIQQIQDIAGRGRVYIGLPGFVNPEAAARAAVGKVAVEGAYARATQNAMTKAQYDAAVKAAAAKAASVVRGVKDSISKFGSDFYAKKYENEEKLKVIRATRLFDPSNAELKRMEKEQEQKVLSTGGSIENTSIIGRLEKAAASGRPGPVGATGQTSPSDDENEQELTEKLIKDAKLRVVKEFENYVNQHIKPRSVMLEADQDKLKRLEARAASLPEGSSEKWLAEAQAIKTKDEIWTTLDMMKYFAGLAMHRDVVNSAFEEAKKALNAPNLRISEDEIKKELKNYQDVLANRYGFGVLPSNDELDVAYKKLDTELRLRFPGGVPDRFNDDVGPAGMKGLSFYSEINRLWARGNR